MDEVARQSPEQRFWHWFALYKLRLEADAYVAGNTRRVCSDYFDGLNRDRSGLRAERTEAEAME